MEIPINFFETVDGTRSALLATVGGTSRVTLVPGPSLAGVARPPAVLALQAGETLVASHRLRRWHHTSPEEERDRNFAGLFPWVDLLFGTFYMPAGQEPEVFGWRGGVPRRVTRPTHLALPNLVNPLDLLQFSAQSQTGGRDSRATVTPLRNDPHEIPVTGPKQHRRDGPGD
jgi:hypothetical protein